MHRKEFIVLDKYMSVKEASQKWMVTPRQVQLYCKQGILKGAFKLGNIWVIPADCPKPIYKFVSEDRTSDSHSDDDS